MSTETFPGRFESLEKIREFVIEAAKDAGFPEPDIYAVELAVDEACSNIIEHAYGGEGRGDILCSCDFSGDHLTIVLRDDGAPFDPNIVPEPNYNASLEQLKPGGAGLFLMRKMMDEVKFEFTPDQGNILTMMKHKD